MNNSSLIPFPQRSGDGNRSAARERVTPQSLEAEQSTLGAMLMERDAIARAVELLTADAFYRELHRKIFWRRHVALRQGRAGRPHHHGRRTAPPQPTRRSRRRGLSDSTNRSLPQRSNVESYAKAVAERHVQRQLINTADQIQGWAFGEVEDVNTLVDKSEKAISRSAPSA
jgi:replicative DNA helicase